MALSTEISATKENIWVFLDSHNHRWWAKIGCIVPTSLLWLFSWVIVKMMRWVECWRNEVISLGEAETSGRMRECKKLYKLSKIFQNLCPRIQYTQCKSKQSSISPPNKTTQNWSNVKCTQWCRIGRGKPQVQWFYANLSFRSSRACDVLIKLSECCTVRRLVVCVDFSV